MVRSFRMRAATAILDGLPAVSSTVLECTDRTIETARRERARTEDNADCASANSSSTLRKFANLARVDDRNRMSGFHQGQEGGLLVAAARFERHSLDTQRRQYVEEFLNVFCVISNGDRLSSGLT
jgi:hypothetical protein